MSDHVYLSTGCLHGEHEYCQATYGVMGDKKPAECKFCEARCVCLCHKEWRDVVDDLTEVWHFHPHLGNEGGNDYQGPALHTFLGMTWEQYAACEPGVWHRIPEGVRPYIRAQHKRWVEKRST